MFESLKKKFSGTIGKITDKISEEEEEALKEEGIPDEDVSQEETGKPETPETQEKI